MKDGFELKYQPLNPRTKIMKFLIMSVTVALLTLSSCNDPKSDENNDDRTEQDDQEGDDN